MSSSESNHLKVVVISLGSVWKTKVSCNTKIIKFISTSLSHFRSSGMLPPIKSANKHWMVLVRTRAVLNEAKTAGEEGLRDGDEVLLVEHQISPKQAPPDLRGPSALEIQEATKHLERRNTDNPKTVLDEDDLDYTERFSKDSPRIFVSLIECAASILNFTANGMETFNLVKKEFNGMKKPTLLSVYVKQLTEMGFSEDMVVKALTLKKMDVSEAMDWLLEHDQVTGQNLKVDLPSTSKTDPASVYDAFQNILQTALKNKHENFKLDSKHVQQLKNMGYEENEIEQALRETDNGLKAAISLLSGNNSRGTLKNGKGLDPNGTMYKALMSSETIQINLTKPKFILALLSILENPRSLSLWLKDHEVNNALNQIILIHNTETSRGKSVS